MWNKIKKVIGYILLFFGGIGCVAMVITFFQSLFTAFSVTLLLALLMDGLVFFGLAYLGYRMIISVDGELFKTNPKRAPVKKEIQRIKKGVPVMPKEETVPMTKANLGKFTLYTVMVNHLEMPLQENGVFYLFARKEDADAKTAELNDTALYTGAWVKESLPMLLSSCMVCGYKEARVYLDHEEKMTLDEFREYVSFPTLDNCGVVHPMIVQKIHRFIHTDYQMYRFPKQATVAMKIEKDLLHYEIGCLLCEAVLLVPLEERNGKKVIEIINAQMPNGQKWKALFTDQFAMMQYMRRNPDSASFPNLLMDVYKDIKKDNSFEGIMINPGREEFKLDKSLLERIYKEKDKPEFIAHYSGMIKKEKEEIHPSAEVTALHFREEQTMDNLGSFDLYVLIDPSYNTPHDEGKVFHLFAEESHATLYQLKYKLTDTKVQRIPVDQQKEFISECLACGYEGAVMHLQAEKKLSLKDMQKIFDIKGLHTFGMIHPFILQDIRSYKMHGNHKGFENSLYHNIWCMLAMTELYTITYKEAEQEKIAFRTFNDPRNKRYLALFTDHFAFEKIKKPEETYKTSYNLLMTAYKEVAADETLEGIVINPGRETFFLNKVYIQAILDDCNDTAKRKKYEQQLDQEREYIGIHKITVNLAEDLFMVPIIYDDENESTKLEEPDYNMHFYPKAGMMAAQGKKIFSLDQIPANYHPATKASDKMMHIRLLQNVSTGKQYVPLFISYETLTSMMNTIHVGVISFEEARNASRECAGVILGPGIINQTFENDVPISPVSDDPIKKCANLMSGQLVARYKKTHEEAYKTEYCRRLKEIGFNENEAENLFLFELMILKSDHVGPLCDQGYIMTNCFNMQTELLPQSKNYYIDHQMFLCSEIVKIWDEAEWRYTNLKNNSDTVKEEVFEELFRLSRYGGGELFVEYLQMIAEKSHTDISKIQAYAKAEHDMLFRCKWNTEQKQPHLYSSEER